MVISNYPRCLSRRPNDQQFLPRAGRVGVWRLALGWVLVAWLAQSFGVSAEAAVATTGAGGASPVDTPMSARPHRIDWTPLAAFTQGMAAITQGDNATVSRAVAALGQNPLATYLQFRWLMDTAKQNPDLVMTFLKDHPNYLFSTDLKKKFLSTQVQSSDWAMYLTVDALSPELKSNTRLACHTLQATVETGKITPAQIASAEALWVQGRSQPSYCDPIFAWLKAHDRLTPDLYRQRIRAAVLAGNLSLGKYLVRAGQSQKITGLSDFFDGWLQVEQNPKQVLDTALSQRQNASISSNERGHLIRALTRLARLDPQATHKVLAELPARWKIPSDEQAQIARRLALKAAYTRMPQAYGWLKALPDSVQNEETRTWRARAALRIENWPELRAAISAMPVDLSQESEWQYWWARADAALGDTAAADARLRALLHEPDYYGFLAADRLGIAYPWPKHPPLPTLSTQHVAAVPAVQLAFYLRAAGLIDDARRAFSAALDVVPSDQLPALTILAEQSQWYDRVSITIAKMRKQNDPTWFAARFPTPWPSVVAQQAAAQGVDANWLYAVIRRESLFMADVGSGVGAQGLMQLMPRTAKWINRKADLGLGSFDLHDPTTSITLGSAYLAYLNNRFPGQLPLAIAAYNAGPGRVKQWLPETQTMPGDVWVDTILFDETRHYVRAVLAATMIYAWRDQPTVAQGARQGTPRKKQSHTPETLANLLTPVQPLNPVPAPISVPDIATDQGQTQAARQVVPPVNVADTEIQPSSGSTPVATAKTVLKVSSP